jgi:hypothetical protein
MSKHARDRKKARRYRRRMALVALPILIANTKTVRFTV